MESAFTMGSKPLVRAITLAYHDVAGGGQPPEAARAGSPYTISYRSFLRHLQLLADRSVPGQVCSIEARARWQELMPIFLTFDDGAQCACSCIADELDRAGFTGHFFITSGWVGRPGFLSADQICDLHRRGHVIGTHSRTHPERMSHLKFEQIVREWKMSRDELSSIIGAAVRIASVPGGYYSRKVGRAAAAAGIDLLFTSEPTMRISRIGDCALAGRFCIRRATPDFVVAALAGGKRWPRSAATLAWTLKKGIKLITGGLYPRIRRKLLARHV